MCHFFIYSNSKEMALKRVQSVLGCKESDIVEVNEVGEVESDWE